MTGPEPTARERAANVIGAGRLQKLEAQDLVVVDVDELARLRGDGDAVADANIDAGKAAVLTEEATRAVARLTAREQELEAQVARLRAALEAEERAQELCNTSDDTEAVMAATAEADRLRREALGR